MSATYGTTVSAVIAEGIDLSGTYAFTDTDSRTLTNFYFDPDPTPQATVVGFNLIFAAGSHVLSR